jgi:uncharacterized protein
MSPPVRPRRCPICRKPAASEHFPFCSPVCRDRDLLRWLDDGYAIPARPAFPADAGEGEEDG